MKYFGPNSKNTGKVAQSYPKTSLSTGGLVSFSVGSIVSAKSYDWNGDDLTGWNLEAAYQTAYGAYFNRGFHLELQKFGINGEELSKLSLLMSFSFPRRLSFPVYIGVAGGPGYFFKQLKNESELSLDYKAYLGLRLNRRTSQYFLQSGVKNHIHVLSDGQFIGWYVSSGVSYKF